MIKLQNVTKNYKDFSIKDISFSIDKGEYLVILGPTGAGKTLILELISGIIKPDAGNIYINNKNVTNCAIEERKIGIVYQDYMLFPHYTVKENIEYGLKLKDKFKNYDNEINTMCDIFKVSHLLDRYPRNLSGGESGRVALIRSLILNPDILLLDEPFSSLDIMTRDILMNEIKTIHKKYNTTFIHIAHDFEEALSLASKVCVLNQGSLLQFGNIYEVFRKPKTNFVAHFVGSKNIFYGDIYEKDGNKFVFTNRIDIALATDKVGKKHIVIRPEDIIVSLKPIESSARNKFRGKVKDIIFKQHICEVTIDVGIEFVSFITKKSFDNLKLDIGKDVWITFKAMEVHVF